MKKYLIFFLFWQVFTAEVHAQPAVDSLKAILDLSLDKFEEMSLHRRTIDWKTFRANAYRETDGITNRDSLLHKFSRFYEWLNDDHGFVQTETYTSGWNKTKSVRKRSVMLDSVLRKGPYFKVALIGKDIGYFRIPQVTASGRESIEKQIKRLTDSLCQLSQHPLKGWIIDLRLNRGGNVWPMLGSLSRLFKDGPIGGIKFLDERDDRCIIVEDGKLGYEEKFGLTIPVCKLFSEAMPVVVLTGQLTASSGETVALAFKSRPNAILIGETTAGYTTSNNSVIITSGVQLNIATAFMKDNSGEIYPEGIPPAVLIEAGDNFYELEKDEKVKKALEWLAQKK